MLGAQSTLRRRLTMRRSTSLPKESMKLHLQDYCSSTSIHALKYVAEPRRPTIEKAWWLIILITCFVCNIMLIRKMWFKYNQSPPEDFAVYEIPLPAITICNEIKIKKSLYDALKVTEGGRKQLLNMKYIERYSDMTSSDDVLNLGSIFGNVTLPKKGKPKQSHTGGVGEFSYGNSTDSNGFPEGGLDFLIEATPSLSEMMTKCVNVFTLNDPDCTYWFELVLTDLGVCYSANAFPLDSVYRIPELSDEEAEMDWDPERGVYRLSIDRLVYPIRAFSNGRLFGFSIELKTNMSEVWEHRNNEENSGFKVQLHRPEDFPLMGEPPVYVPVGAEVVVMVKPVINTISEGLKAYQPKDRKCYANSGEKWLSFFRIYTQKNCELECLTNFTFSVCNCVAIHMPRNKSMPVCSPSSRECVLKAEIDIMVHWKLPDCKCWPSCFSLEYKVSSLQIGGFQSNASISLNEEGFVTSKLVVFFEDNKFPNNERREIVDLVDFLSNCGGLLGLFSGMSILSFCEIFYYLTLRLWNNIRLVREKVIFKAPLPAEAIAPKDPHAKESGDNRSIHSIS